MIYQNLFLFFNKMIPITQEEWAYLESKLAVKNLKKNEDIGVDDLIFVDSGLLAITYESEEGVEVIKDFCMKNDLTCDYLFYETRKRHIKRIYALTNSKIYHLSMDQYKNLSEKFFNFKLLEQQLIKKQLLKLELKEFTCKTTSVTSRYQNIKTNYPEIYNHATKIQIASFLGVSRATLGRLT